jgi:glutamine amidotransferase
MMRVAIIDYGSGNLHSARKAFERAVRDNAVSAAISVTDRAEDVAAADRIVLPGVGAFADCRAGLDAVPGMVEALREAVEKRGRPFLGICVGAQLMAERGLEKRVTPGLGWIGGDVAGIVAPSPDIKIPQIGWNTLDVMRPHPLLAGIPTGQTGWHAYFVHSFHIVPSRLEQLVATTDHGGPVTAIVGRDNMAGTQFHPEKSQKLGLKLIANFLEWKP